MFHTKCQENKEETQIPCQFRAGVQIRTAKITFSLRSVTGRVAFTKATVRTQSLSVDWITLRSELYLVQSQHVEVADVVLLGVSDPGPALLLVDHLPDVLAHKLTLGRKNTRYVTRAHLIAAF